MSSIYPITLSPSKLPSSDVAASPFKINRPKRAAGSLEPKKLKFDPTEVKKQKIDLAAAPRQFEIRKEAETLDYLEHLPLPMQEQALFIEHKLSQIIKNQQKDLNVWERMIRTKIIDIVGHTLFSDERKLAELGLLYWLLANERLIPVGSSLLEARQEEIQKEAIGLKTPHKASCDYNKERSDLLPSGVPAYMIRTFVRMIFTSDNAFNLGGCYAVKALLNGPLSLLISEEQRAQILNTVDQLIQKKSFVKLFLKPIDVHPHLKKFILIDTQQDPDSPKLDCVSVRWDLLTVFFTLVGQPVSQGHCYAIAATANLLSLNYEPLLKLLIEVLNTGEIHYEGLRFPVVLLTEERRIYDEDFQTKFVQAQADQLTGVAIAEAALKPSSSDLRSSIASLEQHVGERFGTKKSAAQALMLSLKQNLLQQTLISILQFISLNSNLAYIVEEHRTLSYRFLLLRDIERDFFKKVASGCKINPFLDASTRNYVDRCCDMLEKKLYFVDRRSRKKEVIGGKVIFDDHSQGLLFKGTLEDYTPFMQMRRLFVSQGKNTFAPVDKISDFVTLLYQVTEQNIQAGDSLVCKEYQNLLKTFLTKQGITATAGMLKEMNSDQTNFEATIYAQSDAFFVIHSGGCLQFILSWDALKNPFSEPEYFTASNEIEWFEKLCNTLATNKELKNNFANRHDPWLLITCTRHAFNLTPRRFEKYLYNPDLSSSLLIPGQTKLLSPLTESQKRNTLWYTLDNQASNADRDRVVSHFVGHQLNCVQFLEECKKIIPKELHLSLNTALNRALEEINSDRLIKDLNNILKILNLPYYDLRELTQIVTDKGTKDFSPYEAALLIHKALLSSKHPYFIPAHQCEEAIRTYYSFPAIIELANLNWISVLSEKLDYSYLVLKYDYVCQKPIFYQRDRQSENLLSDRIDLSILDKTTLWFESSRQI